MSLYVLDTYHVSLYQMGQPSVIQRIMGHIQDRLAVTVTGVVQTGGSLIP